MRLSVTVCGGVYDIRTYSSKEEIIRILECCLELENPILTESAIKSKELITGRPQLNGSAMPEVRGIEESSVRSEERSFRDRLECNANTSPAMDSTEDGPKCALSKLLLENEIFELGCCN